VCVRTEFRGKQWNRTQQNPVPQGRPSLAPRFRGPQAGLLLACWGGARGKVEHELQVPEGRPSSHAHTQALGELGNRFSPGRGEISVLTPTPAGGLGGNPQTLEPNPHRRHLTIQAALRAAAVRARNRVHEKAAAENIAQALRRTSGNSELLSPCRRKGGNFGARHALSVLQSLGLCALRASSVANPTAGMLGVLDRGVSGELLNLLCW